MKKETNSVSEELFPWDVAIDDELLFLPAEADTKQPDDTSHCP